MDQYFLGIAASVTVLAFVFILLRRGVLREKYAVLWLFTAAALVIMALFPQLVVVLAAALGIQIPANLLFFLMGVLLLLVSVQLSYELSQLESKTRRLAEELALLQQRVDAQLGDGSDSA